MSRSWHIWLSLCCSVLFLREVAAQTCNGYCGGNAGSCWCDDACFTYNDCCSDYEQQCKVPLISVVSPNTGTTAGGTAVTLSGGNFGGNTGGAYVRMGGTTASVTSWNDANIVLSSVAGSGTGVTFVVNNQYGNTNDVTSPSFNYDAPVITALNPSNGPTSGGTTLTITGTSLGTSGSVTIGGTSCTTTSWTHTKIVFQSPVGYGEGVDTVVTVSGQSSGTSPFYYDAPSISSTSPSSGLIAGNTLTIYGSSFGNVASALKTITVGGTTCNKGALSQSHTVARCTIPVGSGTNQEVLISVDGRTSNSATVNYAAPSITGMNPSSGVSAGGTTVTLTGSGFDTAGGVVFAGTSVSPSSHSDTQIILSSAAGEGTDKDVYVVIGGQTSNIYSWDYSAPTVSSINPTTGATAGGTQITVTGTSFGTTGTVAIGTANCPVVTRSHTQLVCTLPSGAGANLAVKVTVQAQSSNTNVVFSYTAPSVSGVDPTSGATTGATLVISGSNFGSSTGSVSVGGVDCFASSWSDSSITCALQEGEGTNLNVQVTQTGQSSSSSTTFNYDPPTMSSINPTSATTAGGSFLTITGTNFGTSGSVAIGGYACSINSHSHTQIVCSASEGRGTSLTVVTTVGGQSVNTLTWSYSAPTISYFTPTYGSTSGSSLTLIGASFDTDGTVYIDGVPHTSITTWTHEQVVVVAGPGVGTGHTVQLVTTGSQSVDASATYSYSAPVLASISPSTASTAGGTILTLSGSNFGASGGTVTVGGSTCTSTTWAHSQVRCSIPVGVGVAKDVILTVGGQSSNSQTFSYSVPSITTVSPSTAATNGGTTLTLTGTSMGTGSQATVTVDGETCTVTSNTHTQVRCTLPAGQGTSLPVRITVGSQVDSSNKLFSYSAPTISSFTPFTNLPTEGGPDIVITGTNFGLLQSEVLVLIGSEVADVTAHDHGSITVTCPSGQGSRDLQVRVAGQSVTASTQVQYASPTITDITTAGDFSTAGSVTITLAGSNFGSDASVAIDQNACPIISQTDAQILCTLPVGQGTNLDATVTVASITSDPYSFSYSSPSISLTNPTSPFSTDGGNNLDITGTNFGTNGVVTVGSGVCTASSWSHTSISCSLPEGQGLGNAITVTVSGQTSSGSDTYDYDAPTLTSVNPTEGTTAGGTPLTIVGTNMGTSGTITVGGSTCTATFHSHSLVVCTSPEGRGQNLDLTMDISSQSPSSALNFDYLAPTIAFINPTAGSTAGTTTVTLQGTSFDTSGSVTVGGNGCSILSWSHTQVIFTVAEGSGTGQSVILTTVGTRTSNIESFDYNPPSISSISPSEAVTGGVTRYLTIAGSSFGTTATVVVGSSNCPVTAQTHTSITCSIPDGQGLSHNVQVTVDSQTSNIVLFSYSNPTITGIIPSTGPTAGATDVTIEGSSFGTTLGTVTFGSSDCPIVSQDHTAIVCTLPAGAGTDIDIRVDVDSQPSNSYLFDYDAPTISGINPTNGITDGGYDLTITGTNFGASDTSATTYLGGNECTITSISHVQIICSVPAGEDVNRAVLVTVEGQTSNTELFNYNAPTLTDITPDTDDTNGGTQVAVTGTNFGVTGYVTINGQPCTTSGSITHSTINCLVPAGQGVGLDVTVRVASQSVSGNLFSYNGPRVDLVNPSSGPTSGGTTLTLTGASFGTSGQVTIDGNPCPIVGGTYSHNSLQCTLPSGEGTSKDVVLTVASLASTPLSFSYDPPSITSLTPDNGITNGGYVITLVGTSFGTSGSVTVDGGACPLTGVGYTHNRIECTMPAGLNQVNVEVNAVGQTMVTTSFQYDAPIIDTITPGTADTNGGDVITLNGHNFGASTTSSPTLLVEIDGNECTLVTNDHNQITCSVPEGFGVNVAAQVTVATLKSSTYDFTYNPPNITRVEGSGTCVNGNVNTYDCPILGDGATITVHGTSFGTAGAGTTVTIGGTACDTGFSHTHSQAVCDLPIGVGFDLPVEVTWGSSSDSVPWLSYIGPEFGSGSIAIVGSSDACSTGTGSTSVTVGVAGGEKLCIPNDQFGTDASRVNVTFGTFADDYKQFNCEITSLDASYLACSIPPGVGKDLQLLVAVNNPAVGTQVSPPSSDTITYDAPSLTGGTIRARDKTPGISVAGTETSGEFIQFEGTNFGIDASLLSIHYGFAGAEKTFECTEVTLPAANTVQCRTESLPDNAPTGPYVFVLTALNSISSEGTDTYSYPTPPEVYRVEAASGCTNSGNTTVDCPTAGGVTITLHGSNFADDSMSIKVGATTCEDFIYVSTEMATATLPAGTGFDQIILVYVKALFSRGVPLVSYSAPVLAGVSGCEADSNNPTGTTNCVRESSGSVYLTLTGTNLGASDAIVLVDGIQSADVIHDGTTPHEQLTFALPDGKGTARAVLLIQANGEASTNQLLLDYATCPITTHDTATTACDPCDAGYYSDVPDLQDCKICDLGTFAASTGASTCTKCSAGTYSAQSYGSEECLDCNPGSIAAIPGLGSCTACSPGSIAATGALSVCSECDPGTWSSAVGSSSCSDCDGGKFAPNSGSISCDPCSPGKAALPGSSTCDPCDPGYYQGSSGRETCDACALGTVTSASGQLTCTHCESGTFANATGMTECLACPSGSYSVKINGQGASSCTDCAAGFYIGAPGQGSCLSCTIGTFTNSTAQTACRSCQPGSYNPGLSATACSSCNEGRFASSWGSASCSECPIGTYAPAGSSACTSCAPGSYQDEQGQGMCDKCPIGYAIASAGQAQCLGCPSGFMTNETGLTECYTCWKGTFSKKTSAQGPVGCTDCPVGTYTAADGQESCSECPSGTYAENVASTACIDCELGKFAPSSGASTCQSCQAGTFARIGDPGCTDCSVGRYNGASQLSLCFDCEPGKYQDSTGQSTCEFCNVGYYSLGNAQFCSQCPVGKFANSTGQTHCYSCPVGTAQSLAARSTCTDCAAGSFIAVEAQAVCSLCPAGFQQPSTGQTYCDKCQPGTYASSPGSQTCPECLAGSFSSGEGALVCVQCSTGQYASTIGLSTCTACDPGRYNELTGQSKCTPCGNGTYTATSGQAECLACPAGTYAPYQMATVCTDCEAGKYTGTSGSISCTDCGVGSFSSNEGAVACDACSIGYFAETEGQDVCDPCLAGSYTSLSGQSTCVDCEAGKYQNSPGQASCRFCPTGRYTDGPSSTGYDECTQCPTGRSQSLQGTTYCVDCEAGKYNAVVGQAACDSCAAGYFTEAPGADICSECPQGTFQGAAGQTTCSNCTQGAYTAEKRSVVCEICPVGTFSQFEGHDETCTECPSGKYQDQIGQSSCFTCADGYYTSGSGQAECLVCPAGTYSDLSQPLPTGCTSCPAGTYQSSTGQTRCDKCETGTFTDTFGQVSCTSCAAGSFAPSQGLQTCYECPAGSYSESSGSTACISCEAGKFAPNNSTLSCTSCAAGTYAPDQGLTACLACDPGDYQDLTAQQACKPCPSGTYVSGSGQAACLSCAAGSYSDTERAATCTLCQKGKYQTLSGQIECNACPAGQYAPTNGSVSCEQCAAGYNAPGEGYHTCLPCESGSYQAERGQGSCLPCATGTARLETGQVYCPDCDPGYYANTTGQPQCDACIPGRFSEVTGSGGPIECEPCAYGKYTPYSGQSVCEPCPLGSEASTLGQPECDPCAVGRYAGTTGTGVCDECAPGRYAPTTGSAICLACDPGYHSADDDADKSDCDACLEGEYQPSSGQAVCLKCPPGQYQDSTGQASCKACPLGRFSNQTGLAECFPCATGTYASGTGARFCDECPVGYHQEYEGQGVCTECPIGRYTDVNGTSICTQCESGRYQPTSGLTTCEECDIGKYVLTPGATECLVCPTGTYANQTGTAVCPDCPPGQVNPLTGQFECTDCPLAQYPISDTECGFCTPGRFGEYIGQDVCTPCPPGQYNDDYGLTFCTNCTAGYHTSVPKQTECQKCDVGTYAPYEGIADCFECAPGKYQSELGSTVCVDCAFRYYSPNSGQYICEVCPPGTYAVGSGLSYCQDCEPGKFGQYANQTECFDCSYGEFTGEPGSVSCTPCPARTYNNKTGVSLCNDCLPGRYQDEAGALDCKNCTLGKYSNIYGGDTCELCAAGTYGSQVGEVACTNCDDGTFQSSVKATYCTDCVPGRYSSFVATQGEFCNLCPGGYFSNTSRATACYICSPGRYSSIGSTTCDTCTAGKYSPGGRATCSSCDAGTASTEDGEADCDECTPGYYQPGRGEPACIPCEEGKYTDLYRQTACIPCEAGEYTDQTARTACTECETGRYQSSPGTTTCENCDVGRFADVTRSESCLFCEPGGFANRTGQPECTPCQPGKHINAHGTTACTDCLPGYSSPDFGFALCIACDTGTYTDMEGTINCPLCLAGRYQHLKAQTVCIDCANGTASEEDGASACEACTEGKYSNREGLSSCINCGAGEFANSAGATECDTCDAGTFSSGEVGAVECTSCVGGTFNPWTGQSACRNCAPGKKSINLIASQSCESCPEGRYAGNGSVSCFECAEGTVAPVAETETCTACSRNSNPNADRTECLCDVDYYAQVGVETFNLCAECPKGADCTSVGTTFQEMETLPDYWRAATSELTFYKCYYADQCLGGRNSTCNGFRTGPLCAVCQDGYYSFFGGKCEECPQDDSDSIAYIALLGTGGFFCFLLVLWVMLKTAATDMRAERALQARQRKAQARAEQGIEEHRQQRQNRYNVNNLDEEEAEEERKNNPALQPVTIREGKVVWPAVVTYKMKIMIGFLQIVTNVGTALEVPWPEGFTSFVSFFDIANFDILDASNMECLLDPGQMFYRKFTMMSVVPPILVGLVICVYMLPKLLWIQNGSANELNALETELSECYANRTDMKNDARKRVILKTIRLVVFVLFLVYPLVSSTVLSLYVCKHVYGTDYLLADFHTICYTDEWDTYAGTGSILIIAYPIGIPVLMFLALFWKRKEMQRPGIRVALGLLYDGFWGRMWWFELVDTAHKLMLTSIIAFFPEGYELTTGMAVCILHLMIILLLKPYKRDSDDIFHVTVQILIFLFLYAGQLYTYEEPDDAMDTVISAFMITVVIGVIVFTARAAFGILFVKIRRWCRVQRGLEVEDNDDEEAFLNFGFGRKKHIETSDGVELDTFSLQRSGRTAYGARYSVDATNVAKLRGVHAERMADNNAIRGRLGGNTGVSPSAPTIPDDDEDLDLTTQNPMLAMVQAQGGLGDDDDFDDDPNAMVGDSDVTFKPVSALNEIARPQGSGIRMANADEFDHDGEERTSNMQFASNPLANMGAAGANGYNAFSDSDDGDL